MDIRSDSVPQDGFGNLRALRALRFGRARGPARTAA